MNITSFFYSLSKLLTKQLQALSDRRAAMVDSPALWPSLDGQVHQVLMSLKMESKSRKKHISFKIKLFTSAGLTIS